MIRIASINKVESIKTGRLISKRSWINNFDTIISGILSATMIFYGILFELTMKVDGDFTAFFIYFLSPFLIIGGLYCIYRILVARKLTAVKSNLPKYKNHKLLKEFLIKYHYPLSQEKDDMIISEDEYEMSYNGQWRKEYIFILDDFTIYFNIKKVYPWIAPPVLFAHLLLKRDLVKFISERT